MFQEPSESPPQASPDVGLTRFRDWLWGGGGAAPEIVRPIPACGGNTCGPPHGGGGSRAVGGDPGSQDGERQFQNRGARTKAKHLRGVRGEELLPKTEGR